MGIELPEQIDGIGIALHRFTVGHAEAVCDIVSRNLEHLRPWMPWIQFEPMTVEDRRKLIAEWRDAGDHSYGIFSPRATDDATLIGIIGVHQRIGEGGVEVGYWADAAHTGKGHVTQAVTLVTAAALDHDEIDRVEIHHDEANVASMGVPERAGYTFISRQADEVTAPAEVGIELIWRATAETWAAAKS